LNLFGFKKSNYELSYYLDGPKTSTYKEHYGKELELVDVFELNKEELEEALILDSKL
jgi:hypothetical protein